MALKTSLQGYWKLEETSGSRADAYGANTLTDVNTVTSNTGKIATAAQFTSANSEALTITDNASLSMGAEVDFSLACWVYLDTNTADRPFIYKGSTGFNYEYALKYKQSTDRFFFQVSDGTANEGLVTANNLGSPSTATWYYITAWHDAVANTVNISVNNGTADSVAFTQGSNDGAQTFYLGRLDVVYHDGRLDEVAIWKKVLSASERTELYNGGNGLAFNLWDTSGGLFFSQL